MRGIEIGWPRVLLYLSVITVVSSNLANSQQPASQRSTYVTPKEVIEQYCAGCHNEGAKAGGGLVLTSLDPANPGQNAEQWEKVVRKLRARHMPPPGMPRPDEKTYDAVVAALENGLDRAAAARPNPGRTDTFRRLNRTEYHNAIRDLLALDVDVVSLLPSDETALGFDNITVGELSPTLLDRYLAAAEKISALAVGSPIRSPGGETFMVPADQTQESHVEGLPFGSRGGTEITYSFPLDAEYEIQVRLARDRDSHVEGLNDPQQLEISLDGRRIQLFQLLPPAKDVPDHYLLDKDLHVRVAVKAGPHVIGAAFAKKTSALLETELKPYQVHFNMDRHPRPQPAVYTITVLGPYQASGAGDTPSRRRIFICRSGAPSEEAACATRILSTLARRAYRRPATDTDVEELLKFYEQGRSNADFDSGIELALRALLVSPKFLFRMEKPPAGVSTSAPYRISDLDLATRLSFFLWSSIPDDELLNLAAQGKLRDPQILDKQVRRMLADPRSEALVTSFADQWLFLRNLQFASPDPRLFPDFDDNLRQSLRRETELFVGSVMQEDRNVLDLLRANYTFLNERLAKHYGIPNIYGDRFRKVEFGPDAVRGGLLSQGSILLVTSYATRTSPVIRGKWILSNLLASPPPPPPPLVPELKPANVNGKFLTMRERLAEHRSNAACAGCHRLMDPLGFALENYDGIGRWRTEEGGVPVDTAGNLPDGREFKGVSGLKQALLSRPELFVFALSEKLLTYGLGRKVEYYDAPAVRDIVRASRENDYRFSSLILGVVNSTPFQMRRSQ
jgi:mono/diheme cytochrome c family protein